VIRVLVILIACAALTLGYRAWFSDVGYFALAKMEARVEQQKAATQAIATENEELMQEVIGLQHTLLAVESRARTDLGMIKEGESFYLVVDDD